LKHLLNASREENQEEMIMKFMSELFEKPKALGPRQKLEKKLKRVQKMVRSFRKPILNFRIANKALQG